MKWEIFVDNLTNSIRTALHNIYTCSFRVEFFFLIAHAEAIIAHGTHVFCSYITQLRRCVYDFIYTPFVLSYKLFDLVVLEKICPSFSQSENDLTIAVLSLPEQGEMRNLCQVSSWHHPCVVPLASEEMIVFAYCLILTTIVFMIQKELFKINQPYFDINLLACFYLDN
jgi:hypothetical protein